MRKALNVKSSAPVVEAGAVAEELHTAPVSQAVGNAHPTPPESYDRAVVPASDVRAASSLLVIDRREPHPSLWALETAHQQPRPIGPNKEVRAKARALMLELVEPWCWKNNIDRKVDCELAFCNAYEAGEIAVPDWVRQFCSRVSRTTLHNWRKLQFAPADGAPIGPLGGRFEKQKGGYIHQNPELEKVVHGILKEQSIVAAQPRVVHRRLQEIFKHAVNTDLTCPSYAQVLRYLQWFKAERWAQYLALTSPKDYRNKVEMAIGRLDQDCVPNSRWQLDYTPLDLMLKLPGATEPKRFHVAMCLDVATRRRKLLLSVTPKGITTALLLMACIEDWGMPDELRPDNGSEFKNNLISHDVCRTLGIVFNPCTPGRPMEKGNVEKALGDLMRDLRTEPSFVGHSVDDRQRIREAKGEKYLLDAAPNFDSFQAWLDSWVEMTHNRAHGGLGMESMTPLERLEHYQGQGWQRRDCPLSQTELRRLCYSKEVKARRDYLVFDTRRYITENLAKVSAGQTLRVTMDGLDLRNIHVYNQAMTEYYGTATWDVFVTREELMVAAQRGDQMQKGTTNAVRAGAREGQKIAQEWQRRPDKALGANALPAAAQQITAAVQGALQDELRPVATGGVAAGNVVPIGVKAAAAEPKEEAPNRYTQAADWFVFYYQRQVHLTDEAKRAEMAQVLREDGTFVCMALHCKPDEAYALGLEFGMPDVAATLRDDRAEKERNQAIFAARRWA
ncbi:MAG: DDE-type integrase/transposase/recombinase [Tildeniella torsiva UHER 1998/13D]|nr:DDE-type integrase/transposase/recombinase [Tildeniella torsiva UHER 1998/13D]